MGAWVVGWLYGEDFDEGDCDVRRWNSALKVVASLATSALIRYPEQSFGAHHLVRHRCSDITMDHLSLPRSPEPRRDAPPSYSAQGSRSLGWTSGWFTFVVIGLLSLIPIVYSLWSLAVVAWSGDIGVSCVLGL
jgi:hypothetical protein